jgi:hypothetical protein
VAANTRVGLVRLLVRALGQRAVRQFKQADEREREDQDGEEPSKVQGQRAGIEFAAVGIALGYFPHKQINKRSVFQCTSRG